MIVITGASSGIGLAAATQIAAGGAPVVVVCRDEGRGAAALRHIRARGGRAELVTADLASQRQVRALAARLVTEHSKIEAVVHNAAMVPRRRTTTEDGVETQLAVNLLAPFQLTHHLLPALRRAPRARLLFNTSLPPRPAQTGAAQLDAQQRGDAYRLGGWAAYYTSKTLLALWACELALRLRGSGITANLVHPGAVDTNIAQLRSPRLKWLSRALLATPEEGARSTVWGVTEPSLAQVSCHQIDHRCRTRDRSRAFERADAAAVWQRCAALTGLPDTLE